MAKQIQRRSRAMPKLYDLKKGTNKQTRANWWLLSYANNRQWIYTFVDFCNQIRKKRRKKHKHIDETTTRWNNVPLGWLSFSSTHTYRHAKWHGWRRFVLDGSLFVCDKNCIYFFFPSIQHRICRVCLFASSSSIGGWWRRCLPSILACGSFCMLKTAGRSPKESLQIKWTLIYVFIVTNYCLTALSKCVLCCSCLRTFSDLTVSDRWWRSRQPSGAHPKHLVAVYHLYVTRIVLWYI